MHSSIGSTFRSNPRTGLNRWCATISLCLIKFSLRKSILKHLRVPQQQLCSNSLLSPLHFFGLFDSTTTVSGTILPVIVVVLGFCCCTIVESGTRFHFNRCCSPCLVYGSSCWCGGWGGGLVVPIVEMLLVHFLNVFLKFEQKNERTTFEEIK